jgi:hypothetical protein
MSNVVTKATSRVQCDMKAIRKEGYTVLKCNLQNKLGRLNKSKKITINEDLTMYRHYD